MKERKYPLNRVQQSPDLRDVVKDSMYREARGVTIKSFSNNERAAVIKHMDSPRPLQRSKGTKDVLPRISYDGRETRDTIKTRVRIKELPRFSLDSKASSLTAGSALNSRLSSLRCDLHLGKDDYCRVPPAKEETGSHSRSSSIVTKLMGLDDLPDSITTDDGFLAKPATTAEKNQRQHVSSSQPRKAVSARKAIYSKMPVEPAPWKQQDCSQQSQKMAKQSGKAKGKAPADSSYPSSSVYGQIEKRIAELEFRKSGKDLRALKQILEAMQKTKQKSKSQKRDSEELKPSENSCSNQNSYQQPVSTIKEPCRPKKLSSSTKFMKVTEKVKISSSRTQDSKYERENPALRERASHRTPMGNNAKGPTQYLLSAEKNIIRENCTTSGRGCGMVSPRMEHTVTKPERGSRPKISTSESDGIGRQLSKKVKEKCAENGRHRMKSMDLQLPNDRLSNFSSETRCSSHQGDATSTKSESNNSVASDAETDDISSVFSLNSREHQDYVTTPKQDMHAVKLTANMMEQPSPVSVLDTPFYSEGSPSPVKKISIAFLDKSLRPDETEWNLQSVNHLAAYTESHSSYKDNQKSGKASNLIHKTGFLEIKPCETAANSIKSAYQSTNPRQRYINKILITLGLFNDTSIIQVDSHLLSLDNIFNSNEFHVLREEDDPAKDASKELIKNTDQMKVNQKIQRKVVADVADEILVHKITSGRLFTMGGRKMGLQGLLKEVHSEVVHLCRMVHSYVGDEHDSSIRALNVDMKYESDDWTAYTGEVPALVLDIERLIFKDLINEAITC